MNTLASTESVMDIDLVVYIRAILNYRWWILASALTLGLIAAGYSYTLPNLYEASARTAVVDQHDPGGVNPDERRAPEVLTLVEHGFILGQSRDNHLEVTLAKLHSREFTLLFMDAYNIWAYLNPEQWDWVNHLWLDGFKPDRGLGHKQFREDIRFIDHDEETDLISIRFRWTDAKLVSEWANAYVDLFNKHMRDQALLEVESKQRFLETELERSQVIDIQQSIYRLMEAQMAIEMLANSRGEFALEYIDPAVRPYDRHSPGRKKWTVAGAITGLCLSTGLVISLVMYRRVKAALMGEENI